MAIDPSSFPDKVDPSGFPDKVEPSSFPDKGEPSYFSQVKQNIIPDIKSAGEGMAKMAEGISGDAPSQIPELAKQAEHPLDTLKSLAEPITHPVEYFKEHPVQQTLNVIGAGAALFGGMDFVLKKATPEMAIEGEAPKPAQIAQENVGHIAKELTEKVIPSDSLTPEAKAINEDTSRALLHKTQGIPDAMVDSSPKLKGTDTAPALKPEIVPGTRGWSQDVWNRLVIPSAQAVAKQGEWGKSLAQDMISVRDVPGVRYGMEFGADFEQAYNRIPEVFKFDLAKQVGIEEEPSSEMVGKVTEQVGNDIANMLEGKDPQNELTPNLRILRSQLLQKAQEGIKRVADWAKTANDGAPIKIHRTIWTEGEGGLMFPENKVVDFAERENYFPRVVKADLLEALIREDPTLTREAARHMVVTKQAPNPQAGMELIKAFRKGLIDKKNGNIERSRELELPEHFYERNAFKVIPQYMRMAYQRLHEIQTYGLNDEKALNKITNLAYEGHDEDLALRTYRRVTGRDPIDMIWKGTVQGLRNWSTASMIQFQTTLYHLPRTIYPAVEAGYLKALKGFAGSFSEASEIESRRMGINLTKGMSEFLKSEYGGGKGLSGKAANAVLEIEQIKPLDRFQRKFAGIVGEDHVKTLADTILRKGGREGYSSSKKIAAGKLQDLGIDPEKIKAEGKISDQDLMLASKRFSDRWMGNPDPTNIPMWASTNPVVNMAWQFKNFMYVISNTMGSAISRAVRSGDMATLARISSLPMAGAAVYGIRHGLGLNDTKYVKDPKMNMALNILRDTAPLPISTEMFFKVAQGRRGINDLLNGLFPAISNVASIVGDVSETVNKGHIDRQTKKDLERHIPLVGTAISHL